ncbi:MAG: hypothetical protein HJJLKODD_02243 [Phycisphaerae bacterium]|nr:hypothetical protein [Phycisphaerae bacterium]
MLMQWMGLAVVILLSGLAQEGNSPVESESIVTTTPVTLALNPQMLDVQIPDPLLESQELLTRIGRYLSAEELAAWQQAAKPNTFLKDLMDRRTELASQLKADNYSQTDLSYWKNTLDYLSTIDRPNKVQLSLSEAVKRALDHSYTIRVQSYGPAIAATRIVEAESAFDLIFSSQASWNENNTPVSSQLQGSNSTSRVFNTAIGKRLPTGMTVQTGYNVVRSTTDNQFVNLNPAVTNQWSTTFRQPLLRGFGLDYNRAAINVAQLNRRISEYDFRRTVQDETYRVEQAYWQLVQARRTLTINARLIAEFQKVYDQLQARVIIDVSQVTLAQSLARLDTQKASFERISKAVRDSEDQLKTLLNDPDLNLADELELIPVDFLIPSQVEVDRMNALQSALDNRTELKQAELRIETARINVGVAKNETLPQLDASLTYNFDSLGTSQHDALGNLTDFDFHSYTIGLTFEYPLGNRGPRAAQRRARLEHAQALAALKQAIERIIYDVNIAIREIGTSFAQIAANSRSVISQENEVKAIVDRAERRDPSQLNIELNALSSLANNRQNLLQSLIDYHLAISGLEYAKGTLLEYNNISITDAALIEPKLEN